MWQAMQASMPLLHRRHRTPLCVCQHKPILAASNYMLSCGTWAKTEMNAHTHTHTHTNTHVCTCGTLPPEPCLLRQHHKHLTSKHILMHVCTHIWHPTSPQTVETRPHIHHWTSRAPRTCPARCVQSTGGGIPGWPGAQHLCWLLRQALAAQCSREHPWRSPAGEAATQVCRLSNIHGMMYLRPCTEAGNASTLHALERQKCRPCCATAT